MIWQLQDATRNRFYNYGFIQIAFCHISKTYQSVSWCKRKPINTVYRKAGDDCSEMAFQVTGKGIEKPEDDTKELLVLQVSLSRASPFQIIFEYNLTFFKHKNDDAYKSHEQNITINPPNWLEICLPIRRSNLSLWPVSSKGITRYEMGIYRTEIQ